MIIMGIKDVTETLWLVFSGRQTLHLLKVRLVFCMHAELRLFLVISSEGIRPTISETVITRENGNLRAYLFLMIFRIQI